MRTIIPGTVNPTCVGGVYFGQMMACKEGEECPDNACPFYYSSDSQVIEIITDDEVGEYSVVASELIVALKEGSRRKEAIRLAETANARIVGQLPTYGLYLFKLGLRSLGEMDQVMEALSSKDAVLYTSYNGVMESTHICQADSDNYNHSWPAKCPWLDTNYFQGLLLFDSVYRAYSDHTDLVDTTHGPVRVAVIEAEGPDKHGRKNHFYLSHPSLSHLKEPGRCAFIGETDKNSETKTQLFHANAVLGMLAATDDRRNNPRKKGDFYIHKWGAQRQLHFTIPVPHLKMLLRDPTRVFHPLKNLPEREKRKKKRRMCSFLNILHLRKSGSRHFSLDRIPTAQKTRKVNEFAFISICHILNERVLRKVVVSFVQTR